MKMRNQQRMRIFREPHTTYSADHTLSVLAVLAQISIWVRSFRMLHLLLVLARQQDVFYTDATLQVAHNVYMLHQVPFFFLTENEYYAGKEFCQ